MAKFTRNVISDLQTRYLGVEKTIMLDGFLQVDAARQMIRKWCKINRGYTYKTRTEELDNGTYVFFVTLSKKEQQ